MVQVAQQWDTDAIKRLLETNDRAVQRALWQLYKRQTPCERTSFSTQEVNDRGFTASDAAALTKYAKFLTFRPLSHAEIQEVRPRLMKYSRQLLDVVVSKQLAQLSS